MTLCKGCQDFENRVSAYGLPWNGKVVVHENYAELSSCADTLCVLCKFIRRELHYYTSRVNRYRYRFSSEDFESLHSRISIEFRQNTSGEHCYLHLGEQICPPLLSINASDTELTIQQSRQNNLGVASLLELSRNWLAICQAEHKDCSVKAEAGSAYLPTRLLDVGQSGQTIRLVYSNDIVQTRAVDYVTLSYCWGRRTDAACTTKENKADRLTAIGIDTLPQTLQDAVTITRAFGVQYLWIDALCIVQGQKGENEDWQREHPFMGKIYRHSLFTIAASGAKDSSGGCFRRREAAKWPIQDYQITSDTENADVAIVLKPTRPDWMIAVEKSVLASRGWVLQERMLARRTLFWTDDGLFWSCKEMKASECETNPSYFSWKYLTLDELVERIQSNELESRHAWTSVLENLSGKALTVPTDKLPAVAGLGNEVARLTGGKYEMGVFKNNMVQELAWLADFYISDDLSTDPPAARLLEIPSWSWASTHQKLKFRLRSSEPYSNYKELATSTSLDEQRICVRSRLGTLEVRKLHRTILLRADMAYHPTRCTFQPIGSGYNDATAVAKKEIVVFDTLADTLPEEGGSIRCIQWMSWKDEWRKFKDPEGQTQCHTVIGALIVAPVEGDKHVYRRIGWLEVVDALSFDDEPVEIFIV